MGECSGGRREVVLNQYLPESVPWSPGLVQAVQCVTGLVLTQSSQGCFAVTQIFVNRAALIKKYRVHYEILVWPLELDLTKKRLSLGSCIEEVGNTSTWYLISIWYQLIWYGKLITKEAETQSWWILNSSDNQRWGGKGQFWLSSPWGVPSLLGVVCREAEVL